MIENHNIYIIPYQFTDTVNIELFEVLLYSIAYSYSDKHLYEYVSDEEYQASLEDNEYSSIVDDTIKLTERWYLVTALFPRQFFEDISEGKCNIKTIKSRGDNTMVILEKRS
jgi:hypothetical protein